jgi:cytochrome bd-type quinol oxidase subunit 2
MEIGSSDLLTAAAVIVGFGITVIMFRVQREIQVQEKGEPNWLAWSDYLILGSILLTIGLAILPLLMLPRVSTLTRSLARISLRSSFHSSSRLRIRNTRPLSD